MRSVGGNNWRLNSNHFLHQLRLPLQEVLRSRNAAQRSPRVEQQRLFATTTYFRSSCSVGGASNYSRYSDALPRGGSWCSGLGVSSAAATAADNAARRVRDSQGSNSNSNSNGGPRQGSFHPAPTGPATQSTGSIKQTAGARGSLARVTGITSLAQLPPAQAFFRGPGGSHRAVA